MGQSQASLNIPQDDAGERYRYHPLTGKSIRLIHLRRSKEAELYCTLEHANLDESVKYTALSYAWGDGDVPFRIKVRNERKISIGYVPLTKNLYNALNDLWNAPHLQPKIFWIDQIAINQDDLQERGSQVALMAEIYQRATQVVTYLGPGTEGDGAAFRLMKRVEAHFQRQFELKLKGSDRDREVLEAQNEYHQNPLDPKNYRHLILSGNPGQVMLSELDVPQIDLNDPGWQTALEISSPSCSRRMWMVQENMLNKRTIMLRGTVLLEWELVAAFAGLRNSQPVFVSSKVVDPTAATAMFQLWGMKKLRKPLNLMEFMWMLQPFACFDPRDRVYACLGIACDGNELGIVPDYAHTIEEVYADVARRTLLHHQVLDSLDFVMEPNHALPYPSWAPQRWGDFREHLVRRFHFSLGGNWCASGDRFGQIIIENDILIAPGVIVDTISSLQTRLRIRSRGFYDVLFHEADTHCRMLLQAGGHNSDDLKGGYIQFIDSQISDVQQCQSQIDEMISWATKHDIDDDVAATGVYGTIALTEQYPQEYPAQKGLQTLKRMLSSDEKQLRELSRIVTEHPHLFSEKREPFKISSPSFVDGESVFMPSQLTEQAATTVERTIFFTENGRFGSISSKVNEGDDIAVLSGGKAVYVLRPGKNDYRFLGSAFLYGFMFGQARLEPTFEDSIQTIRIR